MTDEGSFAAKTASNLNMDSLLCVKHKKSHILDARAGLGDRAGQFVKDMNGLMFDDISVEELNSRFNQCKKKYGDVKTPSDFMTRFEKIKEKICYAHTKNHFTVGTVATSRAEGTNSRIKGNGKLKTKLAGFTLVEMFNHVLAIASKQDLETIEELKRLRLAGKRVSNFYTEEVEKSKKEALPLLPKVNDHGDGKYSVPSSTVGKDFESIDLCSTCIHRGDEYTIPRCSCAFCCSTLVTCPCICAASF